MASILINQGTQTAIANDTIGTVNYQVVKVDMGTAGVSNPFSGTLPAVSNLEKGTITRLENGTVQANMMTGTVTSLLGGSIVQTVGTVNTGTINAGTLNRVGQVGTLEVGTISSLPNLPGGSIQVTNGTVNTGTINVATVVAGTLTNLISGTINAATAVVNSATISVLPNLPQGSINVTAGTIGAGTIGGKAASGAAASGNPVFVGGTASSGSVYGLLTDASGVLQINGTVSTGGAGTQAVRLIDGTLTELSNLAKGTVSRVEGGTITRISTIGTLEVGTVTLTAQIGTLNVGTINTGTINTGTINLLQAGTITKLEQGSINVTAGTITNLLKAEDAGHSGGDLGVMALAVRNDSGTTLATTNLDYVPLTTDADGNLRISGTVATGAGTQPVRIIDGTVTELSNLTNGSVRITVGTITVLPNIPGGTLTNLISGTINSATAVLNSGTINVATAVISTLPNLPGGTLGLITSVGSIVGIGTLSNGNITARTGASSSTSGSFTANGQAVTLTAFASNYTDTTAFVSISGTHSGLNTSFEVSEDNSLWTPTNAVRTDTMSIGTATGVISDNTNYSWIVPLRGASYMRTKSIAYSSGTANVRIRPYSGPSEPFVSIAGTAVISQPTGTVNLLQSGTITRIEQGSIQVTAGTVASVGTVPGVGVVTSISNLAAGTVTRLEQGSINVTAGTITNLLKAEDSGHSGGDLGVFMLGVRNDAGTALATTDLDYIPLQTDANGALRIAGTIARITNLPDIPGGTLALVSTVSNITNGSIVVTAGTVAAHAVTAATVTAGTVNVATVVAGTLTNLVSGTINSATAVINSATISVLPNLPQGSINVTAGTVIVTAGTTRSDARTTQNILTYGTQVSGTAAIAATIIGSASVGAGTSLWLQDVSIINPYGSVLCVLGFGTAQQGTNIFYRGVLGTQTGVGIEKSYAKAVNAGMTNQDLVMSLGAAGTMDLSISYLIST